MKLRRRAISCGLFAIAAAARAAVAQTVQLPSTVYMWPMGNTSQNAMMSSLAGIVNRSTSGEVLLSPDNGTQPNPRFWLDQLKVQYPQVQSQVQTQPLFFINRYKSKLSGYVLYDQAVNAHSINIATSIAGVTDAIIADPSQQLLMTIAGLPQVGDARGMTYDSVYQQYGAQFNKDMLFHQATYFDHTLRDFAVMNRGFTYFTDPTALAPYAQNQNNQGRIFGWGHNEEHLFHQASLHDQQVVASNHNWSSSTTAKWKVPIENQKQHASGALITTPGKHYVALVMSDGDNATWLTNGMGTDPKYFGSPHRGKFNMTWDFTPSLADMNPVAHNFYYRNASNGPYTDTFVAAGGAGTAFPSQTPDIAGLAASIGSSMAAADLKVTSILDTAYVESKLTPILDQQQVIGMMFKTYGDYYKGRNGALRWHNGKPILSVKYSLWDGAHSARFIADQLNATTSRDPIDNAASYSIVNVHPWSTAGPDGTGSGDPMSNLWQLVQWLDSSKVEVVGLEELFVHLRNHFGAPLPGAIVNATWIRDASSTWGTRTNWTGAMPNFPDATVTFGGAITAPRTVTVSLPVTAGTINFDNAAHPYTIAGTNAITLDSTAGGAGAAAAQINVLAGSHAISAPLVLADDANVAVSPGSTLTVSNLQPTQRTINKTSDGTLAVNNIRAAALNILGGTVRVMANGGAAATSRVSGLSISGSASLNLANNKLIVDDESLASVEALVRSGHNGGAWDGDGIMTTLPDALIGLTTLAISTANLAGHELFGGQSVGGDDVLVMYTYAGDANLDGLVSGDDYSAIDFHVQVAGASGYANGDFNYDGMISGDDYSVVDFNLVAQGPPFPLASAVTPVPEPSLGAVTLPALAALATARRCRRG